MTQKLYTVQQANRTLPLVRRIVEDIVRMHARWLSLMAALEKEQAAIVTAQSEQSAQLEAQIQATASEIEGFVRELAELGVEFKGFEQGLVDFPAEMQGRPVYLCWQLGEHAVTHWHELEGGFAGRQPIETN